MQITKQDKLIINIERAAQDLRRGMVVYVQDGSGKFITIVSVENTDSYKKEIDKLIISKTRLDFLSPDNQIQGSATTKVSSFSYNDILAICSAIPSNIKLKQKDISPAKKLEEAALVLAKIAELLPAIIILKSKNRKNPFLTKVSLQEINKYNETISYKLDEVCTAPLVLQNAQEASIIAYRPKTGGHEHYAIIIGKPGAEPLVRVHSSCYTGDLLASLSCDCRDQLQSAIEIMAKAKGGIILYLMQEGRGIGLVNKLRAYDLKHKGMDTVEANLALGFADDERLFLPAAQILKKLSIKKIKLLSIFYFLLPFQ